MEKIVRKYAERTGALGVHFVTDTERYGKVWELQYGEIGEDGTIEPTGPPVLAYIKDGDIAFLTDDEAFALLALLD